MRLARLRLRLRLRSPSLVVRVYDRDVANVALSCPNALDPVQLHGFHTLDGADLMPPCVFRNEHTVQHALDIGNLVRCVGCRQLGYWVRGCVDQGVDAGVRGVLRACAADFEVEGGDCCVDGGEVG